MLMKIRRIAGSESDITWGVSLPSSLVQTWAGRTVDVKESGNEALVMYAVIGSGKDNVHE